jgi:dihydropteroate synthase
MDGRPSYELRFADGGVLSLGAVTRVMGVINVTPDSFSDGGRYLDPAAALDAACAMIDAGADVLDVGGESTRPGAPDLPAAEEAARVLPVIESIRRRHERIRISVDTSKASVARQALEAGADLVNDVTALSDPDMAPLVRERRVPIVLMHMRGTPRTMQHDTHYDDVVGTVRSFLADAVETAVAAGIADGKILVDPGIGFGKSASGNLSILRQLSSFQRVGRPILIGASRKSFIGQTLGLDTADRLEGSLAVAAWASACGAHVIRVHDVGPTVRVVRMIDAIREAGARERSIGDLRR